MKEGKSKRKDWVKNAAIIFLTVMLILTFFSNTIMNYSLPEVATVYIQQGSIVATIRGSGTVDANDPYSLVAKETRMITGVDVKQGDEVKKGDVIYRLEEGDSAELEAAEAELNAMILKYTTELLSGEVDAAVINRVENGNTTSIESYQSRIAAMQNSIAAAETNVASHQTNVNNLTKQLDLLNNGNTPDTTAEEQAVRDAEKGVSNAQSSYDRANLRVTEQEASKVSAEGVVNNIMATAEGMGFSVADSNAPAILAGKEAAAAAKLASTKEYVLSTVNDILESLFNDLEPAPGGTWTDLTTFEEASAELSSRELMRAYNPEHWVQGNESMAAYDDLLNNYNTDYTAHLEAQNNVLNGAQLINDYNSARNRLAGIENEISKAKDERARANDNLNKAKDTLTTANTVLADKQANKTNTSAKNDINKKLIEAKAALTIAQEDLTRVQGEQTELVANLQAELNLGDQNEQIKLKEAEIEKIKEKSVGSAITAPVDGKIIVLTHVAGETMNMNDEVAQIQVAGKGFTVSFSVTNEQAAKVRTGDVAELQNAWYYNDIKVLLTSIKTDPDNPGKNKLLTFSVSGEEVVAGQTLSLAVGQQNANYELTVPNSSIREDSNGKFILVLQTRNSPLGNRYFAARVDVEILAEDDTNSAISAAVYAYQDYVITIATKPVEAGQQVRLIEN